MGEPGESRVLAVDGGDWKSILHNGLKAEGVEHVVVNTAALAIKKLQTEEFTAVITDGLRGEWRSVIGEAQKLGAWPVLLSRSTFVVREAQNEGIAAFRKDPFTEGHIKSVIDAALNGPSEEQV